MTVDLAVEYIPRRMEELGAGDSYHLRFRHLRLNPGETRIIKGFNQLFILIEPSDEVIIESDYAIFDMSNDRLAELQYEHRGNITVTNNAALAIHVRMIQVIFKQ